MTVCMYVCMFVCVFVYVHAYVYIHVVNIYAYIYKYEGCFLLDFPIINKNRADTVDQGQSTCEALGSISTVPEE